MEIPAKIDKIDETIVLPNGVNISFIYIMDYSNIHIHCFVYKRDADIIKETVLCAQQALPGAHMVVIDDGNNPCPDEIKAEIEKLGAEWRVSTWPRGGNLRGKPCIVGILTELCASIKDENDIVIKIDADTCLMNPDEIIAFINDPQKVICGCGSVDRRIYGCLYCLKAHAAIKTRDYLESIQIGPGAAEDVFVGFSVTKLFPEPEAHAITKPGGKWAAYSWWNYPDGNKYRQATMVTAGNPPPEPLTKKLRKVVMENLRKQAAIALKAKKE